MWQYKVVKVSALADDIEKQLNSFCQEGWELYSITPVAYSGILNRKIKIMACFGGYEASLEPSTTEYCLLTFRRSM